MSGIGEKPVSGGSGGTNEAIQATAGAESARIENDKQDSTPSSAAVLASIMTGTSASTEPFLPASNSPANAEIEAQSPLPLSDPLLEGNIAQSNQIYSETKSTKESVSEEKNRMENVGFSQDLTVSEDREGGGSQGGRSQAQTSSSSAQVESEVESVGVNTVPDSAGGLKTTVSSQPTAGGYSGGEESSEDTSQEGVIPGINQIGMSPAAESYEAYVKSIEAYTKAKISLINTTSDSSEMAALANQVAADQQISAAELSADQKRLEAQGMLVSSATSLAGAGVSFGAALMSSPSPDKTSIQNIKSAQTDLSAPPAQSAAMRNGNATVRDQMQPQATLQKNVKALESDQEIPNDKMGIESGKARVEQEIRADVRAVESKVQLDTAKEKSSAAQAFIENPERQDVPTDPDVRASATKKLVDDINVSASMGNPPTQPQRDAAAKLGIDLDNPDQPNYISKITDPNNTTQAGKNYTKGSEIENDARRATLRDASDAELEDLNPTVQERTTRETDLTNKATVENLVQDVDAGDRQAIEVKDRFRARKDAEILFKENEILAKPDSNTPYTGEEAGIIEEARAIRQDPERSQNAKKAQTQQLLDDMDTIKAKGEIKGPDAKTRESRAKLENDIIELKENGYLKPQEPPASFSEDQQKSFIQSQKADISKRTQNARDNMGDEEINLVINKGTENKVKLQERVDQAAPSELSMRLQQSTAINASFQAVGGLIKSTYDFAAAKKQLEAGTASANAELMKSSAQMLTGVYQGNRDQSSGLSQSIAQAQRTQQEISSSQRV